MSSTQRLKPYGLTLLALSLLPFSGCRLGNYEKDAPGPNAITGYYETLISPTITMCATIPSSGSNGTTTKCPVEPATHVDPLIAYIMTNPVSLQFNSQYGFYELAPNPEVEPNTPFLTLPVYSDNQGNVAYQGPVAGFAPMQGHPNCTLTLSVVETGTYSAGGTFNSGSALPISGRIYLNLTWDYVPSGADCTLLSDCYSGAKDSSGNPVCTQQDQLNVKQFYAPFVDTGILAITDLPNVKKLEYQVSYQ